jgi:hypothetical protein
MMKLLLNRMLRTIPSVRQALCERDALAAQLEMYRTWVPPGHFYSPLPSGKEIRAREEVIFSKNAKDIPAVNLREEEQIRLLQAFAPYLHELPFGPEKKEGLRYYFDNPAYSYSDAIFYYCMIRHLNPRRIVEIGSGYSSCVAADTNELFFDDHISLTFIEPYPQLLLSLLKSEDTKHVRIVGSPLQDVDLSIFSDLTAQDILFVDSTHVSKTGSDVNVILFDILPKLSSGVYVHFHDIFFPFEYPKEWIYEGRGWNEAYLLRAFLQYNSSFKVVLFNTFLEKFHKQKFQAELALCLRNPGGSIWLQKT